LKTERENVKIIGGTFEDLNANSNQTFNKYDKESREWVVGKFLLPGRRILDLGCSIGAWGAFFRKKGYKEIYGVDIAEDRLKTAAKRGYKTFKAHGTKLPFKDASFDAVVCIDVLVHTIRKEDRLKTIAEAARVLRKDGVFVFSIANLKYEELYGKVNFYLPMEKRTIAGYCRPIYLKEAIEAAERAGLKVVEARGIQFITPSVLVKFPALLKLLDFVFSGSFLKNYARVIFLKAVKD